MSTKTFTRDELDDLDLPYSFLHTEFVGEHRWYDRVLGIFQEPDSLVYWGIEFCDPKTELQEDMDPWFDENEIVATEYELRQVTVDKWMPVD